MRRGPEQFPSGASQNQYDPDVKTLINICKRLGIGNLIMFDLSRLSRSGGLHTLTMVHKFNKANIKVISCAPSEGDLDTLEGIQTFLNGVTNKKESDDKSERIKAGNAAKKKRGEPVGRLKGAKDKRPRATAGYIERWRK